ncbi:FAD-binding oxidoreductase [Pseudooceanicola sediminis]|uniref:FAD-binding oxidoreductase n=1 Tax=Pseudooceanicola sediminis TaxID=2211117 RepID=A0A399J9Q8_9RHOB|nr:FAD-binding oxidoreductase [Pseudooceanicola sediminis]KAA2314659.1 FAD-binding oxidoreductase [Puniceibacterium sp. HSS470]RII39386.1 FAD-binding oxidoreductase [Pseudooceanicola sediminis]
MSEDYTDILIIGGGVAGITAAADLAPHGSVRVLERERQLAYHASGRSAAMFLLDYGNDVVRALNEASAEALSHRDGGVLSPRPMMLLGRAEEADAFATEAAAFGVERIGLDEAATLFPLLDQSVVTDAAARHDASDLDTDLMIQNALRRARGAGAIIETGAEVTAIRHDGLWQVNVGAQVYRAATLVNAAGAWADTIAVMAGIAPLGIQPYRRSMAVLPLPAGMDGAGWAFVDAVGERWYAKPQAGKLLVSPSEEHALEPMDAWADDMVLAEGLARFEEMVNIEVTRVEHSWAGLRSFAPDRALVVGRDAAVPEFVWVAAQGGYGFQTALAVSRLVADLVAGKAPELSENVVAALSPARFG